MLGIKPGAAGCEASMLPLCYAASSSLLKVLNGLPGFEPRPQLYPIPERGLYEKSISSLIFLSFGIFLLNSVNDLKAKREGRGKTFGPENPVSNSLRALMSDRPEILQLFSLDEGRRLGEPAGQSSAVNNYLRLVMNLMKVYSR